MSSRPADDMDCSRRSVQDSSMAYDQILVSKIGKTSPRQSVSHGSEVPAARPASSSLSVQSRNGSLSSGTGDGVSGILDVRFVGSPQSDRLSPGPRPGWRDYIDCQSPGPESSMPSPAIDYYDIRRPTSGVHEDSFSVTSRSNRNSRDQSVLSDVESDTARFSPDEYSGLSLRLRAATPQPHLLDQTRLGVKRRASSPPRDPGLTIQTTNIGPYDLNRRKSSFNLRAPSPSDYAPSRGSLSASSSSSLRTYGSFSSTALSAAGTSVTSAASSPYERPSPGVSPIGDVDYSNQEKISLQNTPSPSVALPGFSSVCGVANSGATLDPSAANNVNTVGKLPLPNALRAAKAAGSKIGGLYICECCLKKPKKFDTAEELR